MNTFEKLGLTRTVKAVTKRALLMKIASISAAGLITITGITYLLAVFFDSSGSFTVKLSRSDMMQSGLSLSSSEAFEGPVERLSAKPLSKADNISVNDLPNDLDAHFGDHGTKNYIAYTFHIKNLGKSTCVYKASITISGATKNVDEAIRIRVYTNGQYIDYAKAKKDGSGAEKNTTPFLSATTVYESQRPQFAPSDIDKYTVVMWLEGDDPECTDSIIGGTIKAEMDFKIVTGS